MPPHDEDLTFRVPFNPTITTGTYTATAMQDVTAATTATTVNAVPPDLYTAAAANLQADVNDFQREWFTEYVPQTNRPVRAGVHLDPNGLYIDVEALGRTVRTEIGTLMDSYLRRIYNVIAEHCVIDIPEEEFLKLIREEEEK